MEKWELVFDYYDFKSWYVSKKLNSLVSKKSEIEKVKNNKKKFLDVILTDEKLSSLNIPQTANHCHAISSGDDGPIFDALKKINKKTFEKINQWNESDDYKFYQHSIHKNGGRYISIINTKTKKIYFLIPDINHHIFFTKDSNTNCLHKWNHNKVIFEYKNKR